MLSDFIAGSDVTIAFEEVGDATHYQVKDERGEVIHVAPLPTDGVVTVAADLNALALDKAKSLRSIELFYTLSDSEITTNQSSYVIRKISELIVGVNSFAAFGELYLSALDNLSLETFMSGDRVEQERALIQAYSNLARVSIYVDNYDNKPFVGSPVAIDLTVLADTEPRLVECLKSAQVAEANFVMGGNTVETYRRLGLMSNSAGESSQMFRPAKPMEMNICRDAAVALTGYITYSKKIGRR